MKSAPKEEKEEKADTKYTKERPKWGQGTKGSKALKNSDKDPNYQRNKKLKEARRKERQQKLLAEADKYAKYVPGDPTSSSRARSRSPPKSRSIEAKSRSSETSRSPPSTQGPSRQTLESRSTLRSRSVRSIAPSPPVPSLRKTHDSSAADADSHDLQENHAQNRPKSPPIPALKHKPHPDSDFSVDTYNYDNISSKDAELSDFNQEPKDGNGMLLNGQFVPFVRSTNVLDPAHAESPVPMSRENTAVRTRFSRCAFRVFSPSGMTRLRDVQCDRFRNRLVHCQRQRTPVGCEFLSSQLLRKISQTIAGKCPSGRSSDEKQSVIWQFS